MISHTELRAGGERDQKRRPVDFIGEEHQLQKTSLPYSFPAWWSFVAIYDGGLLVISSTLIFVLFYLTFLSVCSRANSGFARLYLNLDPPVDTPNVHHGGFTRPPAGQKQGRRADPDLRRAAAPRGCRPAGARSAGPDATICRLGRAARVSGTEAQGFRRLCAAQPH